MEGDLMPGEHDQHGDPRYTAMYVGTVTKNDDPKKLGRVKVKVPGLIDPESDWALPLGTGGGIKSRGTYAPPAVGAECALFFNQGDVDQPFYLTAHWGEPGGKRETPGPVGGYKGANDPEDPEALSPADATKVRTVFEGERYVVWADERPGKERLVLRDKKLDDEVEMDGAKGGISIRATAGIYLKTEGAVVIDALSCVINGRNVLPGGKPIR